MSISAETANLDSLLKPFVCANYLVWGVPAPKLRSHCVRRWRNFKLISVRATDAASILCTMHFLLHHLFSRLLFFLFSYLPSFSCCSWSSSISSIERERERVSVKKKRQRKLTWARVENLRKKMRRARASEREREREKKRKLVSSTLLSLSGDPPGVCLPDSWPCSYVRTL